MEKIVNIIKEVEKNLGNYYKENIYQNALLVELRNNGYNVQSEVIVPIIYKGINIGYERADILIYENSEILCILELKSQNARLNIKEINQLKKYLTNLNCSNGYLINFYDKLEIIETTPISHKKI